MKQVPAEDRMTVDTFISYCQQCGIKPKRAYKENIYLYGTVFLGHLYLNDYRTDIFNYQFPLIVINTETNIIKIWTRYGPQVEVNGEKKYNFKAVDPTYIISGLLCNEDEVIKINSSHPED